ncbi:MAG: DoxX family protein [Chlorobi bacterium]|nr:DoxX family protein [Chlorobiota bacterium]
MGKVYKNLLTVLRLIAGIVFIFSGFVKGVDVTGSAIKFLDYLLAFHLDSFQFLALPMAFILPLLEFLTGISLVFGYKLRTGIIVFLLFMLVFTPLTLVLAILNPVKDCGCFGDALIITNWQTFWKNVILLAVALVLYLKRKEIQSVYLPFTQWIALLIFTVVFVFISTYSYRNLPLLDFRPFHTGASIPEGMTIPEGAPEDEYETVLIYEKNGQKQAFSMENFPWQDSTWSFVEQRTRLIREGYVPPIHDFDIILPDGQDITNDVLENPGYTFLLISPAIDKASPEGLKKAFDLFMAAQDHGVGFYLLTSSGDDRIRHLFEKQGIFFNYASTDETTLKTIIRSNPGLLLIRNGVILQKWAARKIPAPEIFNYSLLSESVTAIHHGRETWITLFLILLLAALGSWMNRLLHAITACRSK